MDARRRRTRRTTQPASIAPFVRGRRGAPSVRERRTAARTADAARRRAGGSRAVQRLRAASPTTAANTSIAVDRDEPRCRRRRGSNVVANAALRIRLHRMRPGLHVVRQQPRQPADALEQRSGVGPAGRSDVHAGRRDRARSGRRRRCRRVAAAATSRGTAQGYCVFEHTRDELASELTLFVPTERSGQVLPARRCRTFDAAPPAARSRSTSTGCSARTDRARACTSSPSPTRPPAPSWRAIASARSSADRVAFLDLSPGARAHASPAIAPSSSAATARCAGRRRCAARALRSRRRRRSIPCGAIQVARRARAGRASSVSSACWAMRPDEAQARALVERYREPRAVDAALERRRAASGTSCSARSTVRTPDRAMDLMLNRWLLYQTLACRIWGRSAFYQSSGAFGFRDQLQDVLALLRRAPALVRAQHLCAPRRASSSKATCSTGGTSPAARACARASPTIGSGWSTPRCHYVDATGDAARPR